MEKDKSKSQSPHEDSYVSPNFLLRLVEKTEGLQEGVENILVEIMQDGNFSETTEVVYDQKRSYLTRHLNGLYRMHKVLADQIRTTLRYSPHIGHYFALSSDSTVLCVSKTKDLKSSFSLSSEHQIPPVNDDAQTDKETKEPEVLLQTNSNLDEDSVCSVDGNTKLKNEIQDKELDTGTQTVDLGNEKTKVIELQKKVSELERRMTVSGNVIKDLQQERSIQDYSIDRYKTLELVHEADILEYRNENAELKRKNKQCTSEISKLKSKYNTKENNWRARVAKLRKKLEGKSESLDDLNEKFDTVQEKCSQDNLIQKMETCLNSLQADHVGVLVSFDIAQTVTNELRERVLELEKEVDSQKEVISVRDEEKKEVIRQISSSLEQYKSRY